MPARSKKSVKTRTPGVYDANATRKALLAAAIQEFALKGYDDARVRKIAADAKADPALINRYFGSKKGLFESAVLSLTLMPPLDTRIPDWAKTFARSLFESEGPYSLSRQALLRQISIRSHNSETVFPLLLAHLHARMITPWNDTFPGSHGTTRAFLLSALLLGLQVMEEVLEKDQEGRVDDEAKLEYVARMLEALRQPL